MKHATLLLKKTISDPWFVVACAISSIASMMLLVHGQSVGGGGRLIDFLFSAGIVLLIVGYVYSIQVRSENIVLRNTYESLYEINNIYREKLHGLFHGTEGGSDPLMLLIEEEEALRATCQRIQGIFERIVNRRCMVTIKLVVNNDKNQLVAHSYIRSEDMCIRDKDGEVEYVIGSGENPGFDAALTPRKNGLPCHFYSADLVEAFRKGQYRNQRKNFAKYYRSALLVPIWSGELATEDPIAEPDSLMRSGVEIIGFLSVDTLSQNRLNDGYHLYILSSLAAQMYNFMSLMRGKYSLLRAGSFSVAGGEND